MGYAKTQTQPGGGYLFVRSRTVGGRGQRRSQSRPCPPLETKPTISRHQHDRATHKRFQKTNCWEADSRGVDFWKVGFRETCGLMWGGVGLAKADLPKVEDASFFKFDINVSESPIRCKFHDTFSVCIFQAGSQIRFSSIPYVIT